MRLVSATVLALLGFFANAARLEAAEPDAVAFTKPMEAGIDYGLQGEYVREHDSDEGKRKVGIQVVALGDRKFRAVAYVGGLPGDGWSRGDERHSGEGELKDGQVEFKPDDLDTTDGVTAILKYGKFVVVRDKETVAELKKVKRKSPTHPAVNLTAKLARQRNGFGTA